MKRASRHSQSLIFWLLATLAFQLGVYVYLDRVLLAPAPFEIRKDENIPESVASGRVYYSSSRKYMAVVKDDLVEIYSMPGRQLTRLVDTEEKKSLLF